MKKRSSSSGERKIITISHDPSLLPEELRHLAGTQRFAFVREGGYGVPLGTGRSFDGEERGSLCVIPMNAVTKAV